MTRAAAMNSTMENDEPGCFSWCQAYPAATACEFSRGRHCVVFTSSDVARGSGAARYKCWILSQCIGEFIYEM